MTPIVIVAVVVFTVTVVVSLLRSRMSANEAAAIGALRTIVGANTDYHNNSIPHRYAGTLAELPGYADLIAASDGYKFVYKLLNPDEYIVEAAPVRYRRTGIRSFYVDQSGVICGGDNGGRPCGSCNPPCEPLDA